ncbi:MAG: hypothetical protein ACK415_11515 [Thermodesulfovibrionales bacterium]
MHKAGLRSPRLLNVLKILIDGRPHESYELAVLSKNVAISASISELRQNNLLITCYRKNGRFFYQLQHTLVPCSLDTFLRNIEISKN